MVVVFNNDDVGGRRSIRVDVGDGGGDVDGNGDNGGANDDGGVFVGMAVANWQ